MPEYREGGKPHSDPLSAIDMRARFEERMGFEDREEFEKRVFEVTGKSLKDLPQGDLEDADHRDSVIELKNSSEHLLVVGDQFDQLEAPKVKDGKTVYDYFLVVDLSGRDAELLKQQEEMQTKHTETYAEMVARTKSLKLPRTE